jgi:hypothetical protein
MNLAVRASKKDNLLLVLKGKIKNITVNDESCSKNIFLNLKEGLP